MRKVLLVDDEPYILQGLKSLIDWEAEGFEVVKSCANGLEAYEYLKENQVDVIFADIKMPEMTGIELLKKIREEEISDASRLLISRRNPNPAGPSPPPRCNLPEKSREERERTNLAFTALQWRLLRVRPILKGP